LLENRQERSQFEIEEEANRGKSNNGPFLLGVKIFEAKAKKPHGLKKDQGGKGVNTPHAQRL